MFSLLVSGNGEWWETPPLASSIDRFREYSGIEGEAIDAAARHARRTRRDPALLTYEVGAGGPDARLSDMVGFAT